MLVLFFGVGSIIMDLGRPDRLFNVLRHPNFRSPPLWDVCSIRVYPTGSTIYLYLPLIPDLAILRDYGSKRVWFYRLLALGWQGTPRQKHVLHRAIAVMAVMVIPIAVSVHTVVSWVFGMTVQPMWRSTIFGPYFVVGAIFSGIASILIAMALKVTIPPLSDKEIQGKSDEELKKVVGEGFGKMKPVPGLSRKQVEDVVAFVRSLAKP